MALFSPERIDLTKINQGQKYQNGDIVDASAINAALEASAYAQYLAEAATGGVDLLNALFPIGYIYISTSSASPASFIGGTWEKLNDVFLLATGENSSGATGGEKSVLLTEEKIPSHNHVSMVGGTGDVISDYLGGSEAGYGLKSGAEGSSGLVSPENYYTSYTGGGEAHNNMPPYYAVNMWRRIE